MCVFYVVEMQCVCVCVCVHVVEIQCVCLFMLWRHRPDRRDMSEPQSMGLFYKMLSVAEIIPLRGPVRTYVCVCVYVVETQFVVCVIKCCPAKGVAAWDQAHAATQKLCRLRLLLLLLVVFL